MIPLYSHLLGTNSIVKANEIGIEKDQAFDAKWFDDSNRCFVSKSVAVVVDVDGGGDA